MIGSCPRRIQRSVARRGTRGTRARRRSGTFAKRLVFAETTLAAGKSLQPGTPSSRHSSYAHVAVSRTPPVCSSITRIRPARKSPCQTRFVVHMAARACCARSPSASCCARTATSSTTRASCNADVGSEEHRESATIQCSLAQVVSRESRTKDRVATTSTRRDPDLVSRAQSNEVMHAMRRDDDGVLAVSPSRSVTQDRRRLDRSTPKLLVARPNPGRDREVRCPLRELPSQTSLGRETGEKVGVTGFEPAAPNTQN